MLQKRIIKVHGQSYKQKQVVGQSYGKLIERTAIDIAKGNNGGTWATHYTEDQKNVWRERAASIITDVTLWLEDEDKEADR